MTAREWRGRWWLPGKEEKEVAGEQRLDRDEFALTLDGRLPTPIAPPPDSGVIHELFVDVQEPLILGETRKGERVTLLDCDGISGTLGIGKVRESSWVPSAALLGAHLAAPESLRFRGIEVEVDYAMDLDRDRRHRPEGPIL